LSPYGSATRSLSSTTWCQPLTTLLSTTSGDHLNSVLKMHCHHGMAWLVTLSVLLDERSATLCHHSYCTNAFLWHMLPAIDTCYCSQSRVHSAVTPRRVVVTRRTPYILAHQDLIGQPREVLTGVTSLLLLPHGCHVLPSGVLLLYAATLPMRCFSPVTGGCKTSRPPSTTWPSACQTSRVCLALACSWGSGESTLHTTCRLQHSAGQLASEAARMTPHSVSFASTVSSC
jgi:hypothetical protein